MVRRVMVRRIMMWRVMMRCIMVWSAMHFFMMHFAAVRSATHFFMMHFAAVRSAVAIIVAVGIMTMLGLIAAASVIPASMAMIEVAMFAPAVTITPAGPGTHAQEDAVVEVILPVKAPGSAAIGWFFVIAPMTIDGWFADFDDWSADLDGNLRTSRWRQGQARKQSCRAE